MIANAARRFVDLFPGDVLYAVKCNPEPGVLSALWAGGVRHFDCASLAEVALVRKLLPAAEIHFMHPVKSRPAIRDAFDIHGVTDFALDSADELAKILQETVPVGLVGDPPVLGLFVRLALPKGGAVYDCRASSARRWTRRPSCFAPPGRTPPVSALPSMSARSASSGCLCAGTSVGWRGNQRCGVPGRHRRCRRRVPGQLPRNGAVAARRLHRRDQGCCGSASRQRSGSGPSPAARSSPAAGRSWCRFNCGAATRFIVNDGVYGSLSDAGAPGFLFPARRIRLAKPTAQMRGSTDFPLFGPTCDSADRMRGPFRLPADIREGEWIELGQLGAYGACLRTRLSTASAEPIWSRSPTLLCLRRRDMTRRRPVQE